MRSGRTRRRRVDAAGVSAGDMLAGSALGSPHRDDRHDPRARDGRGAEGERRAIPGTAMALAPARLPALPRRAAPQPGRPALARPRPVRPLGRPRLHPPVRGAPPVRLRPHARRPASSSGSGARARPAIPSAGTRPGIETTTGPLGQGFANGVGMAIAQRFLADRYNRPHHAIVDSLDLRDLLRRRPDGGRQPGGGLDRRPPRPRPARLRLRRQPHHDRRHDRRSRSRPRTRASASRRTAGTSSTSTTPRTSTRSSARSPPRRRRRSGRR